MHSSSSELLLDQQQELRRKKLLELVAPKKKKKPPRTCRQRVWFYTTSLVALTAVSAGSSLLFLVPLYVDPAISTLRADFTPAGLCTTVRSEQRSGMFNCTWSSCREGCTSDLYRCWHIFVTHGNASEESVLLVNIKGCGYPPDVDCTNFTQIYGILGAQFPCWVSRENRTVVMPSYDRDLQLQLIIHFFAVPFIVTVVTSVVLCIMHCECQCTSQAPQPRRPRVQVRSVANSLTCCFLSRFQQNRARRLNQVA